MPTPVERIGDVFAKRDDLYEFAGIRGGKVRTCRVIVERALSTRPAVRCLVTASSRSSPQAQIVARVAKAFNMDARLHLPAGEQTPEMDDAEAQGATLIRQRPGHNSVIIRRAQDDSYADPYRYYIPFGMENAAAIDCARRQVVQIPREHDIRRIVVPVGSGMTLAGILHGLRDVQWDVPVLGVMVGANPMRRLRQWGPPLLDSMPLTLLPAGVPYHQEVAAKLGTVELDPIYEAKCAGFLKPRDLLWIVGIRHREPAARGE